MLKVKFNSRKVRLKLKELRKGVLEKQHLEAIGNGVVATMTRLIQEEGKDPDGNKLERKSDGKPYNKEYADERRRKGLQTRHRDLTAGQNRLLGGLHVKQVKPREVRIGWRDPQLELWAEGNDAKAPFFFIGKILEKQVMQDVEKLIEKKLK